MRILITGVSGFVGGALGRHLRETHGFEVVGVSRGQPRPGACDVFRSIDLSTPRSLEAARFDADQLGLPRLGRGALRTGPLDAIVHAAGHVTPWARPDDYERHTVQATANVIALALQARVPQLVYISSSSVFYRDGDQLGITESTTLPATPINAYASAKRRAEDLVRASAAASGMTATILRPRAVFGAGDTVLFPRLLRAAKVRMLPRFTRTDGSRAIGDLVSIDNLVRYIDVALERRIAGDFNLTDGRPVDIYEFLATVLGRFGLPPTRWTLPANVAMRLAAGLELASAKLAGWREPPITRFGVGVLSQSKTFDIAKARAALGPPQVDTEAAVDRFVQWQKAGAA